MEPSLFDSIMHGEERRQSCVCVCDLIRPALVTVDLVSTEHLNYQIVVQSARNTVLKHLGPNWKRQALQWASGAIGLRK